MGPDGDDMSKFYIATPIYYVNDKPHMGHAYTTIAADVLARYRRMRGDEVVFLTGTDENSQKNVDAAKRGGETDIQKYVDRMSALWQRTWDELGITNTDFIRTTEERHIRGVKQFLQVVWDKGDIYEGTYEGWYCAGCEAFKTETEVQDGKCGEHQRPVERISEKNYFFRLSKYRDDLLALIGENAEFIQPASRRNEILNYIRDEMEDISITRETMRWGIPLPQDPSQVIYVWFDALLNYLTAVGYGSDEGMFQRTWPVDAWIGGKDIIKFHAALFPAMLISAGLPQMRRMFVHGHFTIDGVKMSKSLGNVVDPVSIAREYGNDVLRYFLLREVPFGEDGDFSTTRLRERYTGDLANGLGNLVARILGMAEKYLSGRVPKPVSGSAMDTWISYEDNLNQFSSHEALRDIWDLITFLDKFIDREQPWVLAKIDQDRLAAVLYTGIESIRHIARLVWPFMPEAAEKILSALGILEAERKSGYNASKEWGGMREGMQIRKIDILFPKLAPN